MCIEQECINFANEKMMKNFMKKNFLNAFKISAAERKRYVLSNYKDFEVLSKCKYLEKSGLKAEDKILVRLIKSQLQDDWRSPLVKMLNALKRKYNLKP